MENNQKFATHIEVRNELMKMQQCGGAMINPFALHRIIFEYAFSDEERQKNNSITIARVIATTFCALCNEYFVIYRNDRHPKTDFYMSDDRWEKYYIVPSHRNMATEFLQRIGLISCDTKTIPSENEPVTTYKINLETLRLYSRAAEELHEQEKAKRKSW